MLTHRLAMLGVLLLGAVTVVLAASGFLPNLFPFQDPTGLLETFSTTGSVNLTGPFFQTLGTNGRSCGTCHQAGDAWTVSAADVAARFDATDGLDPIFRPNDGSNCDNLDTSTVDARRQAYSLLISRGLIRIFLPVPAGAEFTVVSVNNPYGCNDTTTLSMYRRPLPSTNLRFLSTLMWDGRESSPQTGTLKITDIGSLQSDLMHQSVDATLGHAQATPPGPTSQQQQQIMSFEMALSTAQAIDTVAETLSSDGATGGPVTLVSQNFFIGINDPLGQNPTGAQFNPVIFTLFNQSWVNAATKSTTQAARASILRGQTLFNSRPISIDNVAGINSKYDTFGLPSPFQGFCGTCHDTFNVGNHSVSAPLNIGVADNNSLGVDYLPKITLRNKTTGEETTTTDPGRALITGKWADISKFKGPILRGLAARAPYFHNGSAAGLAEVIKFYNVRFSMGLTDAEQADLVAFLSVL